jgi:hypothetical protein
MCGQSVASEAKAWVARTIPTAKTIPIKSIFMGKPLQRSSYNPKIAISTVMPITKIRFGLCQRQRRAAALFQAAGECGAAQNAQYWRAERAGTDRLAEQAKELGIHIDLNCSFHKRDE